MKCPVMSQWDTIIAEIVRTFNSLPKDLFFFSKFLHTERKEKDAQDAEEKIQKIKKEREVRKVNVPTIGHAPGHLLKK